MSEAARLQPMIFRFYSCFDVVMSNLSGGKTRKQSCDWLLDSSNTWTPEQICGGSAPLVLSMAVKQQNEICL